jgi:hypothetical protein
VREMGLELHIRTQRSNFLLGCWHVFRCGRHLTVSDSDSVFVKPYVGLVLKTSRSSCWLNASF